MVTEFIAPAITVIFALMSPLLAWWGSSRFFAGRFEEWRNASEKWRETVDKRLDSVDIAGRASIDENIRLRVDRLEREIGSHESGIRGDIHKLVKEISPWFVKMQSTEELVRTINKDIDLLRKDFRGGYEKLNDRINRMERDCFGRKSPPDP